MEKTTLRLFIMCMLSCATLVLVAVWFGETFPEAYFKTAATFFIFGLANFLLWVPQLAYRFLTTLKQP